MGPWMTAMHLFGDKCKTKRCHSSMTFTFPLSVSISSENSTQKNSGAEMTSERLVIQCPVDSVKSELLHCHTSALCCYLWQTQCEGFVFFRSETHKEPTTLVHNMVSRTCQTWIGCSDKRIIHSSQRTPPYFCQAFCCFWCLAHSAVHGETIAWPHCPFCLFLTNKTPKKHGGWHIFDTVHLFLSLDDTFQNGPRCQRCQMCLK